MRLIILGTSLRLPHCVSGVYLVLAAAQDHEGYRLLIVEDNEADVVLMKKALRDYRIPAEVMVCTDGESAIRLIDAKESGMPNAIILDLSLPGITGLDVLRIVLNRPEMSRTPVMVFTSSPSPADRRQVESIAGVRYLQKPSGLDHFLRAVGENVRAMLRIPPQLAET